MLSERLLDHVSNPRNVGAIEGAVLGRSGEEGNGRYVNIWLLIEQGAVSRAAYKAYGCPTCIACASLTVELALKMKIEKLSQIEESDLILLLGGIPEGK